MKKWIAACLIWMAVILPGCALAQEAFSIDEWMASATADEVQTALGKWLETAATDDVQTIMRACESELKSREESADQGAESRQKAYADFDTSSVQIVSLETKADKSGNLYLVVGYKWTNKSGDTAMFGTTLADTAYQNGIECESGYGFSLGVDTNTITKVQDGYSLTCYGLYKLRDSSPVDLVIAPIFDWAGKYEPLKYQVTFKSKDSE